MKTKWHGRPLYRSFDELGDDEYRCIACGYYFRDLSAFEAHQTKEAHNGSWGPHCLKDGDMGARGLVKAANGHWYVPDSGLHKNAARNHPARRARQ